MKKESKILVIGGFDPSGGAGIIADLETVHKLGAKAASAVTAITVQNSKKFKGFMPVPPDKLKGQLKVVFDQYKIKGAKIGMTGSKENAEVIADLLKEAKPPKTVLDPVYKATTGAVLTDKETFKVLTEQVLPSVSVITPNRDEAEYLLGEKMGDLSPTTLAMKLVEKYQIQSVVITGAEWQGGTFDLVYDGENANMIQSQRIKAKDTHGTGCRHSTALLYYLSKGISLNESALLAKDYVLDYLQKN